MINLSLFFCSKEEHYSLRYDAYFFFFFFCHRVSDIWAKCVTSGGSLLNSEGTVLLKMLLTPSKSRNSYIRISGLSLFRRAHSLTRRCPAKVHTSVPFHCHLCHSHTKGQPVKECAAQDCFEHLHYLADQKRKKSQEKAGQRDVEKEKGCCCDVKKFEKERKKMYCVQTFQLKCI